MLNPATDIVFYRFPDNAADRPLEWDVVIYLIIESEQQRIKGFPVKCAFEYLDPLKFFLAGHPSPLPLLLKIDAFLL